MELQPVRVAIEKFGSVKALAAELGIAPQGISQWKQIPGRHVRAMERITGIHREQLRPDLFRDEVA